MFTLHRNVLLCIIALVLGAGKCTTDFPTSPSLVLYSPGELEAAEIIVRRVNETLLLVCELRPPEKDVRYVWNYLPDQDSDSANQTLEVEPAGAAAASRLRRARLRVTHSGQYMCSAPPHSVTKYVLVQPPGPTACAFGAFSCGVRCVLPAYVCDGYADCARGEDEAACPAPPCRGPDKLNCSSGRCISASQCCRAGAALCRQPACCAERAPPPAHASYAEVEFPAQYEDRRAPDDYGFIQSTIYTVTACALIFMVAVVLLVSAICKLHMKRAALGYAQAQRRTQYAEHRFPPCYEASRLLEERRDSPRRAQAPSVAELEAAEADRPGHLARLGAVLAARYRPVPPAEVELYRRRAPSPAPPATLHLGRFQLSLPRLARRPRRAPPARPVGAVSVDDLAFVRLDDTETYTLNGRTIRLLGASFELPGAAGGAGGAGGPPPYAEAARLKRGPPPAYVSRDSVAAAAPGAEQPPRYDELARAAALATGVVSGVAVTEAVNGDVLMGRQRRASVDGLTEAVNGNVMMVGGNFDSLTSFDSVTGAVNADSLPCGVNVDSLTRGVNFDSLTGAVSGDGVTGERLDNATTPLNLTGNFDNLPAIDSDVNANECARERDNNNC